MPTQASSNASGVTSLSIQPRPSGAVADSRRWPALGLLCLAQFMVILDVTVVNVALPSIGAELGLARTWLTWVLTAYTLAFGGLMLLGGRLADATGRRRTFVAGVVVFTLASLASGLAWDGEVLIAARVAQGVGAALLSPAALAILTTTFQGAERNRALGVWAALAAAGSAIGVVLGGALVSGPGWRSVFFINLPVGVIVLTLVSMLVSPGPRPEGRRALDLRGAAVAIGGIGLLIYGLIVAGEAGWATSSSLVPLGGGLLLVLAFGLMERGRSDPLVRLDLLARRPMWTGGAVMFAASGLLVGNFFITSFVAQRVLALTPFQTGLLFLPVAVATGLGAHLGGQCVGQLGPRVVAAGGFAISAVGGLLLARMGLDAQIAVAILPGFVLAAFGVGMAFVTATTTALGQVEHADAGIAGAVMNTLHEVGSALGVALVSTVAAMAIDGEHVVQGYAEAYLATAVAAALIAVAAAWLLPNARPRRGDRPLFAH